MSALPQRSSSFQCSHPNAFLQPHLHQGGCSGGGHLRLNCQGCCGACSTPFSRFLQPSICSVEDLGVMASGHRPLPSHSLCGRVSLPDGDHSVCAPVGASGGLDGLHRSEGSVPSSAGSSSFSSLSSLHVPRHCLSVQSAVLWPLHGSAGLHQGHGSCFCYTPFYGDPYETVSRRLAGPVCLSGVPPQGSSSITGGSVSGGYPRLHLFPGLLRRRSASYGCTHQPQGFQSCASPPASLWLSLLGILASLAHLVPGGRLGMRFLQLCLHRSWDRQDLEDPVYASMEGLRDLQWWLHLPRLSLGVCLCQVSPDLHFWSDASVVGWGAHLDRRIASGLWDTHQAAFSINARELLAVLLGLHQFQSSLQGRMVAVFCDNTTAVASLRKVGGTRSLLLTTLAPEFLRWTESLSIRLAPQFIPGSNNVLADALSRPHQLPLSEWSLNLTVFYSLRRLWPVQIDLFATSDNHRCSIYFSPFRDPMSAGADAFLQSWDGLQAYTFPPVAIIPRVLVKLRASTGTELTLVVPHWAQRPWFSDLLQLSLAHPVILPARQDLLRLPRSRHLSRISVGSCFLPGDSPAIYQILLRSSGAVLAGAPSILASCISGTMVHLSCVVPQQWPILSLVLP